MKLIASRESKASQIFANKKKMVKMGREIQATHLIKIAQSEGVTKNRESQKTKKHKPFSLTDKLRLNLIKPSCLRTLYSKAMNIGLYKI
jgi:hypothetical protein